MVEFCILNNPFHTDSYASYWNHHTETNIQNKCPLEELKKKKTFCNQVHTVKQILRWSFDDKRKFAYCNDPKFSDTLAWANSVDPDEQSDQGLHCLPFCLYYSDTFLYGESTLFNF